MRVSHDRTDVLVKTVAADRIPSASRLLDGLLRGGPEVPRSLRQDDQHRQQLSVKVRTRPHLRAQSLIFGLSFLFRVLGLSVILAEKLLSARRAKQLDPVRNPKDKHFIHHILWLAREGLIMVEQYILPMVDNGIVLKVLAHKLRASFYHILVLFHNDPPVNNRINRTRSGSGGLYSLYPDPLAPHTRSSSSKDSKLTGRQRSPAVSVGGPVGGSKTRVPPGLPIPGALTQHNNGSNLPFFLPLEDYTPRATKAFAAASSLAESLLPGSHPVRLSVKVEYVAYLYDCLGEREQSRQTARLAIRAVYDAKEGMDDESFEDASEMVGTLGRMMRRGLQPRSQAQITQQITAVPSAGALPAVGEGDREGTAPSQPPRQGQSPGRGRRRGQNVSASTSATSQPTTWV